MSNDMLAKLDDRLAKVTEEFNGLVQTLAQNAQQQKALQDQATAIRTRQDQLRGAHAEVTGLKAMLSPEAPAEVLEEAKEPSPEAASTTAEGEADGATDASTPSSDTPAEEPAGEQA